MDALLILVRHAKAVDRLEAEDDFERGLTPRGREDSESAAARLQEAGLAADLALVSPALRTRQTWEIIRERLGDPPIEDPMALYHASADMLERAVEEALPRAPRIALVGHNPGIGAFAHMLAQRAGAMAAMPAGYPTAAATAFRLASLDFDAPRLALAFNPKG